ncbi:hypothetical protein EV1_032509 [Malus domestica]
MARKRKLPTSPSCQGEGICSESGIDRFSVLPDEVAHHILSFLNFNDLTRVGALSKRCRRFHLSVPVVDFGSDWRPRTKTNQFRARLMSSFDRYLLDRGHNRLRRFHVSWKFSAAERVKKLCDDDYRVHTWIQSAVRCNVEELHLDFGNTVSSFPSYIFRSQSLRSLSVNCRGIFEAPSLSFSSNLHYLSLTSVRIEDERVFQWISCCCKCIKELHLYYIKAMKSTAIESSSLESFSVSSLGESVHLSISGEKLENIDIQRGAYASLKIFAPNLKNLRWHCTYTVCF